MRVSKVFKLKKDQSQLDFVDVHVDKDIPLFVDPFAISIHEDEWSVSCSNQLVSFFDAAITSIHNNDLVRAQGILTNLSEPNETRLGLSSGMPSGRGVSGKQAQDLYNSLRNSKAAQTGLLSEIAECDLFVPLLGPDKISDITTNIIRDRLIEYTQNQCKLHGIPMIKGVAAGNCWDPKIKRWKSVYADLPVWKGRRILLVPKFSVRMRMSMNSDDYYNHYILSYLQAEHLQAHTSLVEALKNGTHRVTKKRLKEEFPMDKDELAAFTKKHPEILKQYKDDLRKKDEEIVDGDEELKAPEKAEALAEELRLIPTGNDGATEYHRLMKGLLEFIFYPHLMYPRLEDEINEGRKRIDITYTNAARVGFFYRLHTAQQVASNLIMVECKNYTREVGNPELDQISSRFSVNRGKFGLLLGRNCDNQSLFMKRCRDTASEGRGFVLPLFDNDVYEMLDYIKENNRVFIEQKLDKMFRFLIS